MEINETDLDWAVQQGYLSPEQAAKLWQAWTDRQPPVRSPKFDFANVAYYFGALIVMVAMGFFLVLAWEPLGGWGIAAIAMGYGVALAGAGYWLYQKQHLTVPGGLLITVAVWMAPVAIFGVQKALGFDEPDDRHFYSNFFTWIRDSSVLMSLGAIGASLVALRSIHFPFLTFPLALALWLLSLDLAPLIFGQEVAFHTQALVTLWFGLACMAIAYGVDLRWVRSRGDYAFWLYLFGLMGFWFSLPVTGEDTEWHRFLFCLINLGLMALSILLKRRLFMVFGGVGVFAYIAYLAFRVFANSILFPLALSGLGLGIIALGLAYQRHYRTLEAYLNRLIPPQWHHLLPKDR